MLFALIFFIFKENYVTMIISNIYYEATKFLHLKNLYDHPGVEGRIFIIRRGPKSSDDDHHYALSWLRYVPDFSLFSFCRFFPILLHSPHQKDPLPPVCHRYNTRSFSPRVCHRVRYATRSPPIPKRRARTALSENVSRVCVKHPSKTDRYQ